jgi:shikimate dehydrogenase
VNAPITGATRVAGIIGHPVEHSRSPAIWNAAFRAAGIDWLFVAFPVEPGGAEAALEGARTLGLAALTVTMPHKSDAAKACDELSATAQALGAVNAIINRDGRLVGDSTDGEGFLRSLAEHGIDAAGGQAVVLGAGGAGRAIVHALGGVGAQVTVAARRLDAAQEAAQLAPDARAATLADAEAALRAAKLVVNATPLGMHGEPPPFDVGVLGEQAVVADTVYHPLETPLLAAARGRGLACVGGLGMLVHQAAISFHTFTGADAPLDAMRAAAEVS